jgi:hypothetical protein
MALQRSVEEGVQLAGVWEAWRAICADPRALAAKLGWDLAAIETIDAYREAAHAYTFPTLAELRGALAPRFEERGVEVPAYELGERCPTVVLGRAG